MTYVRLNKGAIINYGARYLRFPIDAVHEFRGEAVHHSKLKPSSLPI
jgi:hypothetical protein